MSGAQVNSKSGGSTLALPKVLQAFFNKTTPDCTTHKWLIVGPIEYVFC